MNSPVPIAIELLAATHLDHQWWKASGGRPGRRLQDGGAQGKMNATNKKVLVDSDQEHDPSDRQAMVPALTPKKKRHGLTQET